jgi:hypothetical protein
MNLFRSPLQQLESWAVASQQQARRNAMIASTAAAQRRAELIEVEDFLAALHAPSTIVHDAVESAAPAAQG